MTLRICTIATYFWLMASFALASDISTSASGINSQILTQTGANIGIGQVESGRPGTTADGPGNFHADVVPTGVYQLNGGPSVSDVNGHATQVAGVMISKDSGDLQGVAPSARLHASAFVVTDFYGDNALGMTQK